MVTGLGTPVAAAMVNDLIKFKPSGDNTGNEARVIDNGSDAVDVTGAFQATNAFAVSNVIVVRTGTSAGTTRFDASAELSDAGAPADLGTTAGLIDSSTNALPASAAFSAGTMSAAEFSVSGIHGWSAWRTIIGPTAAAAMHGSYQTATQGTHGAAATVSGGQFARASAGSDRGALPAAAAPVSMSDAVLNEVATETSSLPSDSASVAASDTTTTTAGTKVASLQSGLSANHGGVERRSAWLLASVIAGFFAIPFTAKAKRRSRDSLSSRQSF